MKLFINTILDRLILFISAILTITFILPAVILAQSHSPVNIGTAGNFVLLAKTGISTTGSTQITGDIGLSPSAATFITGCGLIMDASGTFSTSSLIVGKVYAADYTDPTPTKMTTAVGDMETAYVNAAGRTSPDYTELYTGDLTGQTLTPGLYNWSTGVLVSAGGVTISGSATDVWIFQISQNLTLGNGAMVTLSGGAQASNIFWQVAGQVTLGTTSAMKGIILCKTLIEIQTGAVFNGIALAQTAVTLDANKITKSAYVTTVETELFPQKFSLSQNYPNPFNPTSTIRYSVPKMSFVKISVYDILGNKIRTLVDEEKSPGHYETVIDVQKLSSGIYLYTIQTSDFVQSKKMIIMK
jgi:hypothetical protein